MPLMMLRCYGPRRHLASMNCNVFACATNVTSVTGVTHPSFILLLLCIVVRCQKFSPSHVMTCMSLYGGLYASHDAQVLRTRKAYAPYEL